MDSLCGDTATLRARAAGRTSPGKTPKALPTVHRLTRRVGARVGAVLRPRRRRRTSAGPFAPSADDKIPGTRISPMSRVGSPHQKPFPLQPFRSAFPDHSIRALPGEGRSAAGPASHPAAAWPGGKSAADRPVSAVRCPGPDRNRGVGAPKAGAGHRSPIKAALPRLSGRFYTGRMSRPRWCRASGNAEPDAARC